MGKLRDRWERKAMGNSTEAIDLQLCQGVVTVHFPLFRHDPLRYISACHSL